MASAPVRGLHRLAFKDRQGAEQTAGLELKFQQIQVHPPIGKQGRYPSLRLTVLHAQERGQPEGRERIQWKLLTNLPVRSRAEAIEKLNWYALRWKIETFHKILKSGCKAEESKLRNAERLTNFIAVCCIVGWRVFWMTMLQRAVPEAPASLALTETELRLLDALMNSYPPETALPQPLSLYLLKVAKLGGCLARTSDPPPGNLVMWRGLSRLTDLHFGFLLGAKLVGN
jgi:hypothetical protein